jgi:hypothetical protein
LSMCRELYKQHRSKCKNRSRHFWNKRMQYQWLGSLVKHGVILAALTSVDHTHTEEDAALFRQKLGHVWFCVSHVSLVDFLLSRLLFSISTFCLNPVWFLDATPFLRVFRPSETTLTTRACWTTSWKGCPNTSPTPSSSAAPCCL